MLSMIDFNAVYKRGIYQITDGWLEHFSVSLCSFHVGFVIFHFSSRFLLRLLLMDMVINPLVLNVMFPSVLFVFCLFYLSMPLINGILYFFVVASFCISIHFVVFVVI